MKRISVNIEAALVIVLALALTLTLALTGCTATHSPQLTQMPDGPLQSYHYTLTSRVNPETLSDIRLWRDDSTRQGLLTVEGSDLSASPAMRIPQPIAVGEEAFDSVYAILRDKRFYQLDTHYDKTYFVDAYGYPAWRLEAVFPEAAITSESGGEVPDMASDDFDSANRWLRAAALREGIAWLATQPVSLRDYPSFSDMGSRLALQDNETEGDTAIVFQRTAWPSGEVLATTALRPAGRNCYREAATGNTWELKWVGEELTLVCRSPKGALLWATLGHTDNAAEWDWDQQVYHLLEGTFTDEQGRTVSIARSGSVSGLLGKGEESLHLYNHRGMPAFRFKVGEYPDERYYGFMPTPEGLDIYDTKPDPDDSEASDRILSTCVCRLRRTTSPDYSWLHSQLLDSHYLSYFSPAARQKMLQTVESPARKTPQDEWNAWILNSRGQVP